MYRWINAILVVFIAMGCGESVPETWKDVWYPDHIKAIRSNSAERFEVWYEANADHATSSADAMETVFLAGLRGAKDFEWVCSYQTGGRQLSYLRSNGSLSELETRLQEDISTMIVDFVPYDAQDGSLAACERAMRDGELGI